MGEKWVLLMSVYTVLTLETVQAFAKQFNLTVSSITPIQNGIENSNYFVELDDGRELVLTLFEELTQTDAEILARFMQRLHDHGLPVAVPLAARDGVQLHILANKPAQFAPRLAGSSPMQPNVAQVAQMGATLAQMHLALEKDPQKQEQSEQGQHRIEYTPAWWEASKDEIKQTLNIEDQDLLDQVFAQFLEMEQRFPHLPQGLIHGDVFRDNTLFSGDQISGLLDFTTVTRDVWLMDIAITINDFCTQYPAVNLDMERVVAFVDAYNDVRRITDPEKMALPVYLAMAACRFWISRVQTAIRNHVENRVNEDVLEKDPDEMRRMLVERLRYTFLKCI
jgi:homoserine kinase type II